MQSLKELGDVFSENCKIGFSKLNSSAFKEFDRREHTEEFGRAYFEYTNLEKSVHGLSIEYNSLFENAQLQFTVLDEKLPEFNLKLQGFPSCVPGSSLTEEEKQKVAVDFVNVNKLLIECTSHIQILLDCRSKFGNIVGKLADMEKNVKLKERDFNMSS